MSELLLEGPNLRYAPYLERALEVSAHYSKAFAKAMRQTVEILPVDADLSPFECTDISGLKIHIEEALTSNVNN